MNELALFAGVGGGIVGTKHLGFRCVCAVEYRPWAAGVLAQRQNDGCLEPFPIWDDVRTFDGHRWRGRIDLLSGGFPCQAFSTAARGRNNAPDLWPEMRRVIEEVRPKYVFAENVSARAIEQAGHDCAAMGYTAEMLPLSAADLGADHVRERYWLLAYADDKGELRRHVNAKVAECAEFREGVWQAEPGEPRLADGVAERMERYTSTGNGQVALVAAAALWSLANADH